MIKKTLHSEVFWGLLMINLALIFFIDREIFLVDLFKSISVQAIIGFLLVAVSATTLRKTKLASLSVMSGLLVLSSLLVQPDSAYLAQFKSTDFRVAHFNVLTNNLGHASLINAVEKSEADLLSFQEVNNRWSVVLEDALGDKYPHYCISPSEDSFGIAIFSRLPIDNLSEYEWQSMPNIAGEIRIGIEKLSFVTSHTSSPITPSRYRNRNHHLEDIQNWLHRTPAPKLAIGDYNCVSWAPQIKRFKADTEMRDSRSYYASTFPSWLSPFGIPIDYIFHSNDIKCTGFSTLQTSSDHKGIVAGFEFSNSPIASR